MLFDTHCHLNYHTDEELTRIIKNAKDFGLRYIMHAGARPDEIDRQIEICNVFSDGELTIKCGFACHPEEVKNFGVLAVEELKTVATKDKNIIAIGETGLDTHIQENEEFLSDQIKSFENHIAAAIETKKPIIVHARGDVAISKSVEMLKFYKKDNISFVLHSYTGDIDSAKKALDLGGFMCFSGIVTFEHAENVRDVAKFIPIDMMFVETDAPFLAPTPMRGKQNETGFVNFTARFISEFLKVDYNDFCKTTTQNAKIFFKHE